MAPNIDGLELIHMRDTTQYDDDGTVFVRFMLIVYFICTERMTTKYIP
jgi:hypothetical protein